MTWLGADELDLLVLGSGVAGLSAAVRAADELALRVGVLTKSELSPGRHPLGAGRRRRGARRRPRLHRPAPRRHARAPVPTCATSTPCGSSSTRARAGSTSSSPWARCSTATGRAACSWPARAATRCPASSTPAGPPPAPRSSGRWSRRCGRPRSPAGSSGSRSTCSSTAVAAWASRRWTSDGQVIEIRSRHVLLATGGAGQLFAATTNPLAVDRRRPGHGPAGRRGRAPTSSSCSSTRPRCSAPRCRGRCCRRRCAGTAP